jgi:hypothetical protein
MQKFYSKDPTAMPIKEVKVLKFNKMDKFAAKKLNLMLILLETQQ